MKIIGGELRGRRIEMPRSVKIRPTPDRVREALFNIIREGVGGVSCLDLFSGSGSLGIEALSRGARKVVFVDKEKRCTDTIKRNLEGLGIGPDRFDIYRHDVKKAIEKLNDSKIRFGLVLMDPPYYANWVKKCLIYLDNYDILSNPFLIVCEHFKKDEVPDKEGGFHLSRRAQYGDTALSFYAKKRDEASGISGDI